MILHYDSPATFFEEALPIGNGHLGAMVYGGTGEERISLNDITLWTGEPESGDGESRTEWLAKVREALDVEDYPRADELQKHLQGHFSQTYQPLGTLWLRFPKGEISAYGRSLNLEDATARVQYLRDGKAFQTQYFVSAPDSVLVIRLVGDEPLDVTLELESGQPHVTQAREGMLVSDGYAAYHAYPGYSVPVGEEQFSYDPERGIHYRTVVYCKDAEVQGNTLHISGVNRSQIIVSNVTSFAGFDKDPVKEGREYKEAAVSRALKAGGKDWVSLWKCHRADYREFFGRVSLNLGQTAPEVKALPTDEQLRRYASGESNPELEALYFQYGRYLLISSSRTPGVPANLQGLWNESMDPPWSCNYTTNINLEENYWPAEAAALPEMHEVLLSFLQGLAVNGRQTARDFYGVEDAWCEAHNSDIWAMTCPVGLGVGDPSWANWNMGGAWLSTHIWEHWLFTRNRADLERDYPVLKGAARFCLGALVKKDGKWITSPSTSPENIYITPSGYAGRTLYGATADLAIVRECLSNARAAALELGDDAFAREIDAILPDLKEYQVGADGALQEWYHDWADREPRHRHQSHLIGAYPGHQIQAGSALADAALKTLEIKGFETTGWSCGWRVNLYARLGDGESAYKMYRRLLRYVSPDGYEGEDARRGGGTYPNLLDAHSPFQIDGNFGGCAGVMEMLVQSTEEGVKPLPALPSAWPSGEIKGVRTRTGRTLEMAWKDGKVTRLKLR
ncbi:MAG: glycoside hydrolase family 95 protein [Bacteroidales bacterium]|nr:glycoside hydrolase family 95 protein [Bacteroidales bacterium]